jgi:DNA-nicking Smr family endonuclease
MRGVRQLSGDRIVAPPMAPVRQAVADAHPVQSLPIPAKASSGKPGRVDGATEQRLQRGQVAVEARIDLHGLNQQEAFSALMRFTDLSVRAGRRMVLVVTGKGGVGRGGGVLRRNVPAWLMASPLAGRILTVAPAHTRHGGDGAFYVLLRRNRR